MALLKFSQLMASSTLRPHTHRVATDALQQIQPFRKHARLNSQYRCHAEQIDARQFEWGTNADAQCTCVCQQSISWTNIWKWETMSCHSHRAIAHCHRHTDRCMLCARSICIFFYWFLTPAFPLLSIDNYHILCINKLHETHLAAHTVASVYVCVPVTPPFGLILVPRYNQRSDERSDNGVGLLLWINHSTNVNWRTVAAKKWIHLSCTIG